MLYAKVIFGLPLDGPFDYIVPPELSLKINLGSRVWVSFGHKKLVGYVIELSRNTKINKLKTVLSLIDEVPILDRKMLLLTRELSEYYCCSWGEAIETALPEGLRKGRVLPGLDQVSEISDSRDEAEPRLLVVQDLDALDRWDIYIKEIRDVLSQNKSAVILFPDKDYLLKAKELFSQKLGIEAVVLYRKEPQELAEWIRIKENKVKVVLGTRSAVFAPMNNLGLLIVDEEQDYVYKQDQSPHYHAREVALMRAKIDGAKVVLCGTALSLETMRLVREGKLNFISLPRKREYPEIKIFNVKDLAFAGRRSNPMLSKYIEDSVAAILNSKGKTLLFLNRKGFATYAFCQQCGVSLRCPRCNVNLVYHFKENALTCHYCNHKISPPNICPNCNSGYIKYSGSGTEKIESELCRIFPQARIKIIDGQERINLEDADIFISTSFIIKHADKPFDLVCVLSIDNTLNRADFRSGEKAFEIILGLLTLANKKIIIQTRINHHRCFDALVKHDLGAFYDAELKERKQFGFPPYKHLAMVKLRGEKEEKVKQASEALFAKLKRSKKGGAAKILSVNPAPHLKLRGSYYWQVLLTGNSAQDITRLLKINLKDFKHSGIIVTVDIDPV